jgi:hypothetical protein
MFLSEVEADRSLKCFHLTLLVQMVQCQISDHLIRVSLQGLKVADCRFLMSNLGSQVIHREVYVTSKLLLRRQSGQGASQDVVEEVLFGGYLL